MTSEEMERGRAEPAPGAVADPEMEEEFAALDVDAPRVGIVMGSKSDLETMEKAQKELESRNIRSEIRVMSAHRDPDTVAEYAKNAKMRGLRVIITGAGLAAASSAGTTPASARASTTASSTASQVSSFRSSDHTDRSSGRV